MKICENCKAEHDGLNGSGRFCSIKCGKSFSTKNKRLEINEKVSNALKGREASNKGKPSPKRGRQLAERITISCENCNTEFKVRAKKPQRFCSKACSTSFTQKKMVNNGTHKGFPCRKDKLPSWAEQTVMNILENRKIQYRRDYKINRFFGDFVFLEKMLILEIDGKQHKERIEFDKNRDEILKSEGYEVVRIPWVHRNLPEMEAKIVEFLQKYRF